MNRLTRSFFDGVISRLDEVLMLLGKDEQHELLDKLAGEIEERMERLADQEGE